jgi:hypothetical protein
MRTACAGHPSIAGRSAAIICAQLLAIASTTGAPVSAPMGARGAGLQATPDLAIVGLVVAPYGARKTLLNRECLPPVVAAARQRDPDTAGPARTNPCPPARSAGVPCDRARYHGGSRLTGLESFSNSMAWQQQMPESEAPQRFKGDTSDLGLKSRVLWARWRSRGAYYSPASASPSTTWISYLGWPRK